MFHLCEKIAHDVIIFENDRMNVLFLTISGYHESHVDYCGKFNVVWMVNKSFIGTLVCVDSKFHCFTELPETDIC